MALLFASRPGILPVGINLERGDDPSKVKRVRILSLLFGTTVGTLRPFELSMAFTIALVCAEPITEFPFIGVSAAGWMGALASFPTTQSHMPCSIYSPRSLRHVNEG